MDELRAEENEVTPYLIFTITDEAGNDIRKIHKKISKGINRTSWNLRYPGVHPIRLKNKKFDPIASEGDFMYVLPGKYNVSLAQCVRGEVTELVAPVEFEAVVLNNTTLPATDRKELVAFQKKVSKLIKAVRGANSLSNDLMEKTQFIKQAILKSPDINPDLMKKANKIEAELDEILWDFSGQQPKASREENWPAKPSINERLSSMVYAHWRSTSAITQTQKDTYEIISEEFPPLLEKLKEINNVELKNLERELEKAGVPYTPGRVPEW